MRKIFGFLIAATFAITSVTAPLAAGSSDLNGAAKFLKEKFKLADATKEFKTLKVHTDGLGMTHVKLEQIVNGIPVYGSQYMVHFDKTGKVYASNGNFDTGARTLTTDGTTNITADDAINLAKPLVGFTETTPTRQYEPDRFEAGLYLYNDNGEYIPVYLVKASWMHDDSFGNWDVFIKAADGTFVHRINNIQTIKAGKGTVVGTNEVGTGIGVLGDTKPINIYKSGATYYMQDMTRPAAIYTYTAQNGTKIPGTLMTDADTIWNTAAQKAGVDAHYYAGVVYDFYKTLFERNSIDNRGMAIKSTVHYSKNYVNAFWNGTQMVYGDGDGVDSVELSGSLDVIAHEMSHGVNSNEADLAYEMQSGALNESFSDIMGTAVEFWAQPTKADWLIGEDVWTPATPNDALRDMANPGAYGDPENMSQYKNYPNNSYYDYGGVHTNSGIPNHAAYTMGTQIGWEKVARVWYRAMTTYFTNTTNFSQARTATLQAAADLYGTGSAEYNAVAAGWNHVGVY